MEQEGNIAKYFSTTSTTASKPKPVVASKDDEAFMADVLGDFDNTTTPVTFNTRRHVKREPVSKSRRLSPPLKKARNAKSRIKEEYESLPNALGSSPPPFTRADDEYDDSFMMSMNSRDEDIEMGDIAVLPSSPTVKAVQRRTSAMVLDDDDSDSDGDVAIMEIKGVKGLKAAPVNMSACKSIPKVEEEKPRPVPDIDVSSWKKVGENLKATNVPSFESISDGKLNLVDVLEEDDTLRFFWIDYIEVNGSLCLFGKVRRKNSNKYVSCFVKVDGVMRVLHFLPRVHRIRKFYYSAPAKVLTVSELH